jgi:hypothetical protein
VSRGFTPRQFREDFTLRDIGLMAEAWELYD